jgi:NAD(P)-dependent dehydrogenase (short-subunit alcohol dehydrogenase family)
MNVLITGGGRGIGHAAALMCGARFWNVGINYQSNAAAAEVTVQAVKKAGGGAVAIRGDVASETDVLRMFDETQKAFGSVNALVNNAGIVAPQSDLADMSAERLRRVFDTNIFGAYLCAREAARRFSTTRGGQGGVIVNVSSAASRLGSPHEYLDYAGSKGAMDSMTLGLARELAKEGVRVNAVRPGIIATEIHQLSGEPDRASRLGPATPMGRAGTAEEVAESIVWLLSDASSYVTGALLDVAGGR